MSQSNPFDGRRLVKIVAAAGCILTLTACARLSSPSQSASQPTAPSDTASAPSDVQLFFDEDSSTLTTAANQKLDAAARLYREGNPAVMFVTGHADTTGSEYPNLVLSGERAKAAKDALVARGIPTERLQLQAMGSSLPRDPYSSAPSDNRRVVITWR